MSGFKKKDSGCQVRKNAAQRTANEEKNKRTLQDCGITVTKKGEDESPTALNSFLPSQSIQVVNSFPRERIFSHLINSMLYKFLTYFYRLELKTMSLTFLKARESPYQKSEW